MHETCFHRRRGAFTLIELLVVISIVGLLAGLLLPAVQQTREAARRAQCLDRLHNLVLGLHHYESRLGLLPPGSINQNIVKPPLGGWGWGALVLADVEQGPLYDALDFHQPTASARNRPLIAQPVELYVCPSDPAPERVTITMPPHADVEVAHGNYCGVEGVLAPLSSVRFAEITDGLSTTLFLGERLYRPGGAALPFTSAWCGVVSERDTWVSGSVPHLLAGRLSLINQSLTTPGVFASRHPGGANFALGDGVVRFLGENMSVEVFEALGTRDGGEAVAF